MHQVKIGGAEIDECPTCHGLYFDNFELNKVDEQNEGDGPELDRILSYDSEVVGTRPKLVCPKCSMKMREHRYSAACEVKVDECSSCGALWLDKGELGLIRKNFASDEDRAKLIDVLATTLGYDMARHKQEEEGKRHEVRLNRRLGIGKLVKLACR